MAAGNPIMLHFLSINDEEFPLINLSQGSIEWDEINFCNYISNMFIHFFRFCVELQHIVNTQHAGSDLSASGKHKCLLQLLTHIRGRFIGEECFIFEFIEGEVVRDFSLRSVDLLIKKIYFILNKEMF